MDKQETTPATHTPGADDGEGKDEKEGKESSRDTGDGLTARDSTGINPEKSGPIDPEMPDMPPA